MKVRHGLRSAGVGFAAVVVTPFVITLLFRLLPFGGPAVSLPFLVATVAGIALLVQGGLKRAAGVGVLIATVLHAVFLGWLFSQFAGLELMG